MAALVLFPGTLLEVIASTLAKTLPDFGEIFRMLSYDEVGSREIAGLCESTPIFSMPGLSKVVELGLERLTSA